MINWISVQWSKSPPIACTLLFCNTSTYSGLLTFGIYTPDTNSVWISDNVIVPLTTFTHRAEINMPGE